MTEKQAVNLLEENLYNAVKYRLNADVEVGSFMSGGIDSTTISVMASKFIPNIKTMTLGFRQYEEYNEIDEALDTARLHNLNHLITSVSPNEILQNIELTPNIYEEPYFYLPVNMIIAKIAQTNGVKVVLNGLGGDELFGGYDVFQKLKHWNTLKKNKSILQFIPNFHQKIKKGKQLANYNDIGEFYSHYFSNYSDLEISSLLGIDDYSSKNVISNLYSPHKQNFADDFEAISFFNLKSYIGNHQMRTVDQCTMNYSVEGRFPMLDHKFIEASFKIPTKYKIKQNQQKYILREVAKKHISPSCLQMKKKGLGLPLNQWFSKELKEFTTIQTNNLVNREILNNDLVAKIIKKNDAKKVWQLVSTELWLKSFFDS
jgi:asparagine synthase (glutamine-hydrolysing)